MSSELLPLPMASKARNRSVLPPARLSEEVGDAFVFCYCIEVLETKK